MAKKRKPTTDKDAIAELREYTGYPGDPDTAPSVDAALAAIELGANPVLEAVGMWARAEQLLTAYLYKMRGLAAVYPDQAIHAQKSGRISTTDPPLAQLPKDMRRVLQPFPGQCWLTWDWDQAELRILAALSRSQFLLRCLENGWDIHTLTACSIFALPEPTDKIDPHHDAEWCKRVKWKGKDDPRRVFAKRKRFKLNYGGHFGSKTPGQKYLGLSQEALETASRQILYADPDLIAWRQREASQVAKTGMSVTPFNRVRRLMGGREEKERQGYDHPMQGCVSDIFNLTLIQVKRVCPYLSYSWSMHDRVYWNCPRGREAETVPILTAIANQSWNLNGLPTRIPAEVEVVYREDGQ